MKKKQHNTHHTLYTKKENASWEKGKKSSNTVNDFFEKIKLKLCKSQYHKYWKNDQYICKDI